MAICKIEKNFSEEEIKEIISSSKTAKEALERFGYKKTNNAALIRKYAEKYNIDISHYPVKGVLEDLTGKQFGHLTVLSYNKEKSKAEGRTYWTCQCDCENKTITDVWAARLKNGATQSCGCLKRTSMIKDLSNQIFGDIKVIDKNEEKSGKGNSVYWNVICIKCGTKGVVRGDTIQTRQSFNCTCPRHSKNEEIIADFLKVNNISFVPQYKFEDLKTENNHYLFYDFAITNNNQIFLIEYQGEQHYHSVDYFGGEEQFILRQKHDQMKRDYCKEHNINLYEITYKEDTISKLKEILILEHLNLEN